MLKSEGLQKRTYCYVIDAVRGILAVLFKGEVGKNYNISNSNSIVSIVELAKLIASLCGKKVVFCYPSDIESKGFSKPQNCILDNTKLCKLGWQGLYDIKSGMTECIEIMKMEYTNK